MNILLPDEMAPESVRMLEEFGNVTYDKTLYTRERDLIKLLPDAHAIVVRNVLQVRGPILDAMTSCKVVGRLGVGLDNIDVRACTERGIEVLPAIGQNASSVAEYVLATALMLARPAYHSSELVLSGAWPRQQLSIGREISGRTLGIVGYGSIGQVTARMARAMGMEVLACERPGGDPCDIASLPLPALLSRSDFVSVHVPIKPETRDMFNERVIAQMKPGSFLINVARGGVVNETALAMALRSGHLAGAAVDVFDLEPVNAHTVFRDVPNLILTPHIAGVTWDSEQRVCDFVARGVIESLKRSTR